MNLVKRRTRSQAESDICFCLVTGNIAWGPHFLRELSADNFELQDAKHILKTGTIFDPPDRDIRTFEWKYKIEGKSIDGAEGAVIFSFREVDRAFLITIYEIR